MGHEIFKAAPKSPSLTKEKLQSMLEQHDFQVEQIISGISVSDLYYSAKIPFQFDYGDRDKDGNPGEKGSHGTHVASTAAGNVGVNDAVMGVAPQAQIINMNVFKSSGGASYSDILAALEDCILLGVDVANLSLGSDCGYIDYDSEDAFTKSLLDVFERTGESGVSLAVAAGNAYNAAYGDAFGGKALASNLDYGLVSEPSTYGESLSVAAVSNGVVKGPYVTVGGKDLAYQDSATISDDENAKPFRSLSARGSIEYVVVPNYGAEEDYAGLAAVDHDDDNQQDEWLISRTTDISGVDTEVHMVFDFYTTYWYTVEYKHCNLQVMASGDGGENWQEIWNLQRDSGLFTAWTKTQAKVTIPESLQNSKDLRFAFVYTGKGGSTLSMDNVQLYAEERDNYVAVTATAGEGGTITPAGEVSVKEGASQTFAIAAQEGYAIADVLVDGQSVGAVDSYTFENVTANHTIAALFTKTASDVQFDNDFESETFPGHGWTLQSTRSDSPYTWYQGTNRNLNTTKQARIDMDYYVDPWGDPWSVGSIRKPLLPMAGGSDKLQDKLLISPVVILTGKTPTLNFDYLLLKYVIGRYCSVTVEATTDGGRTWTTIWNAADLGEISGYRYNGTAHVAVPAAFCTDNAQFAFHFYKKANQGYDGTDAMFAIDNVTMTYGATDPCADGHTLTAVAEVPATCQETGVKAHWVCSVCGKLFSDADGKSETTLEALTIPATGHAWGQPAWTWTGTESASAAFTCGNDASHTQTLPAAVTSEVTTQPGCESTGVRTYTASVTLDGKNYTDTRTEVIPALGHKTQLVGAKAATCTEDGYTGDEVCTVCNEVVKKGEVIPATGHDYKDGKCTNCGETDPNYKPAEPENPGVKTGDEAHTALWLAAASVSLLAAAALLLGKKKHLS